MFNLYLNEKFSSISLSIDLHTAGLYSTSEVTVTLCFFSIYFLSHDDLTSELLSS